MIIDTIENSGVYALGELWKKAFDFLKTLTPETECGKYELQGKDLYVSVDSYETKLRDGRRPETHEKYIDIQFMIAGEEAHENFLTPAALTIDAPYDAERDVAFYKLPAAADTKVILRAGTFVVYFPQDAHTPCLIAGGVPQTIKKAVVKLKVNIAK